MVGLSGWRISGAAGARRLCFAHVVCSRWCFVAVSADYFGAGGPFTGLSDSV